MRQRERECESMYVSLSQMYLIRVGACPQTQGQRQTEMETGQPRQPQPPGVPKTWDHTSVRSSKQEKEIGPRWGAQGQRVRVLENQRQRAPWYDSRAPGAQEPHSTRQRTPPLMGQLRTPEPTSICIRGRGRKVQHGGPQGPRLRKPQTQAQPWTHAHSVHSLTLTHPLEIHSEIFFLTTKICCSLDHQII